jgi:hypothetical protein
VHTVLIEETLVRILAFLTLFGCLLISFLLFGSWCRWYNYLNSECKKGGWSREEDMLLCEVRS